MRRKKRSFGLFQWMAYYLRSFFCDFKAPFLFAVGIAAVGLVVGIVIGAVWSEKLYTGDYLTLMKLGEYNLFGGFFKYTFLGFVCCFLVYLNVFNKWLRLLSVAVIFYAGFRLGMDIACCIAFSVFNGIMATLLFFIPIMVVLIIVLCVMYCFANAYNSCSYSRNCFTKARSIAFLKQFLCFFCIILINNIVFALIIPSIVKLIIVF